MTKSSKSSKNILMITSSFPRSRKDMSGKFILLLAKYLNKLKLNISVLAPSHKKTKNEETINNIRIYRFNYFIPKSIQKVAYGSGIAPNLKKSFLAKIQFPFFFLFQFLSTLKLIKKNKITTIVSHWAVTQGIIGAFAKLLLHKKHILILHGAGIFALKKFFLGKTIARFIIKYSDQLITVSAYLKSVLDNLIGCDSKASVCSMGIDTKFFVKKNKNKLRQQYGYSKNQKIILTVGRLIQVKGIKYAIQTMHFFIKKYSDALLLIIGDGILKPKLIQLVKNLKLEQNIIFLGNKSHSDLVDFYNISDILIMPSVYNNWGQTEAFGLVGVEALSCGLPVIGSKIGGIREFIKHEKNGFLVKPGDPKDIYKCLNRYFRNKKSLWASKYIRKSALPYDWDNISEKIFNVIQK